GRNPGPPRHRALKAAVEAHVRDRRFDAVVESALADPDDFRASSHAYRAAGHRIEVVGWSPRKP
ncbi:zeta toxin family protein, partial [Streptomyces avermitilis]